MFEVSDRKERSLENDLAGTAGSHELLNDSVTHDLRALEVESFRHQITEVASAL